MSRSASIIAIGGVPGAGKSTVASRLATDLGLPCIASDTLGSTIQASHGVVIPQAVDAYWVACDLVFRLAEEFIGAGLSVILDLNLGWQFQWDWLDSLPARLPGVTVVPILLRRSREQCLKRIHRRHTAAPAADPPQLHKTDPKILAVFEFLERLQRPDAVTIDAERPAEEVYFKVSQIVAARVGMLFRHRK